MSIVRGSQGVLVLVDEGAKDALDVRPYCLAVSRTVVGHRRHHSRSQKNYAESLHCFLPYSALIASTGFAAAAFAAGRQQPSTAAARITATATVYGSGSPSQNPYTKAL